MPGPWLVGQLVTADLLNAATYRPYVKMRQTVAQTGNATGAVLVVTFTTEDHDPENWHDNSTNPSRVTPNMAGDYRVTWTPALAFQTTVSAISARVLLNGTVTNSTANQKPANTTNSSNTALTGPTIVETVTVNGTTDYIEVAVSANVTTGTWDTNVAGSGRGTVLIEYMGAFN